MSPISRLAPQLAKTALFQHQRHMATATVANDPIQKIFVDKIREFKASNKGLDEAHKKAEAEEYARLKRVFSVDDENKLAHLDYKFSPAHDVSLHDLDENKEFRKKINSPEYKAQLSTVRPKSALLESIPEQVTLDMHLPPMNKPDELLILDNEGPLKPLVRGEDRPDYEDASGPVTPHTLARIFRVRFGEQMPTIHDEKSPERDVINYPRLKLPLDAPPTKGHIIPASWFNFFYNKTGVTGPVAFIATFGTYLLSKEILVMEHELLTGITSTIIFTYGISKYGPKISAFFRTKTDELLDGMDHWQHGNIKMLDEMKEHYKGELGKAELIKEIYEVRRQDVDVQLEGEYRKRLKTVYDDTRRRLNYLVAVAESRRQIAYKNMVNWVITNSIASIGQKQEAAVLDNCITNLKDLARKNPNAV